MPAILSALVASEFQKGNSSPEGASSDTGLGAGVPTELVISSAAKKKYLLQLFLSENDIV